MRFSRFRLQAVLYLALTPVALGSTTWYVNGVSGSNSNNCLSATTACKTIGHAISLAASGDTVRVAAATYTENLTIGSSLNIFGSGAGTTIIDGMGLNRVVDISSTSAHVTLSGVKIRNGAANGSGGGISNRGVLIVIASTIRANTATASCGGLVSCVAQGGGIYNSGRLTISKSTLSGNTASVLGPGSAGGGGIYSSGTLTISRSILSGNIARISCSPNPCASSADGGGIYNHFGTVFISNSTLVSNTASKTFSLGGFAVGGGISNRGFASISSSTLSGNGATHFGGGINNYVGYSVTLQNSIVANSVSGGNCAGTTSNGFNLSSDGTCNFNRPGDMNNTNPVLGTLGNYGGPTQTIPLLSGSPAIDAGNPSGCTDNTGALLKTDQRGDPRPDAEDSGGCDIGAFENNGTLTGSCIVDFGTQCVSGTPLIGGCPAGTPVLSPGHVSCGLLQSPVPVDTSRGCRLPNIITVSGKCLRTIPP